MPSSICARQDGQYEIRTSDDDSLILTEEEVGRFRVAIGLGVIEDLGRRLHNRNQSDHVVVCDLTFSFIDAQDVFNRLGDLEHLPVWVSAVDWPREGF